MRLALSQTLEDRFSRDEALMSLVFIAKATNEDSDEHTLSCSELAHKNRGADKDSYPTDSFRL